MTEFLFLFCVILGIIFFLVLKNKDQEERAAAQFERDKLDREFHEKDSREKRLRSLVEQHQDVLLSHFQSGRKTDEYGQIEESKWLVQASRFLEVVNKGQLKRERISDPHEVTKLVQAFLHERQLSITQNENAPRSSFQSVFTESQASDAWEFEKLCADELTRLGWLAYVTSGGADQGIDVIAEKNAKKLVVQCKLYGSVVGNKAVQEAISGRVFESANYAAVVAPNGFTKSAHELAFKANVFLLHPRDLQRIDDLLQD